MFGLPRWLLVVIAVIGGLWLYSYNFLGNAYRYQMTFEVEVDGVKFRRVVVEPALFATLIREVSAPPSWLVSLQNVRGTNARGFNPDFELISGNQI